MAEIQPIDIAEAVAKAVPALLTDTVQQFRQGEGGYIRDGEPEGIVAQIGLAVARTACRRFGESPTDGPALNSERFEAACRPYLESITPGNGAEIGLPFTGGQCPQTYRAIGVVTFDRFFCNTGQSIPNTIDFATEFQLQGPLSNVRVEGFEPGLCGNRGVRILVDTATTPGVAIYSTLDVFERALFNPSLQSINFEIAPGQTDNCGDPAPVVRQPRPQVDPFPRPFRFNPVPGVDVNIDVGFDPDGNIVFDIGTGDITVDPFPEGEGGGGGPVETIPPSPGSEGGPQDTGGGGEAQGEAGEGEELVGLLVEVLASPQDANRFDNNQAQPFRGIGYVRMGYPGRLGVDISGGTVISPQFFHAQQRGLTAWAVSANLGFNIRTTPYYRETPS